MRATRPNRKSLGEPVIWQCAACGRIIHCHTTTRYLVTLNHRRTHPRPNFPRLALAPKEPNNA